MPHERIPITRPPLLTDWPTYAQSLDWLERMRALLESANVWTVALEAALGHLGGAVLLAAAGQKDRAFGSRADDRPADEPMVSGHTEANGHTTRATRHPRQVRTGWSIAERLQALGYTEPLTKAQRIKLGHQVVQAYREHRGTSPADGAGRPWVVGATLGALRGRRPHPGRWRDPRPVGGAWTEDGRCRS
jgi:hypothetical protein